MSVNESSADSMLVTLVLLACLAVPIAVVSFGLGAVNLASAAKHESRGPDPVKSEPSARERPRDLQARIDDLVRKAEDTRRRIEEKSSVDVGRIYGAVAEGSEPQWVECLAGGVVLQPQGLRIALRDVKAGAPAFDSAVRQKGHVVLLLRPSGFASFDDARAAAEKLENVRIGYEPVDEDWQLRF